MLRDAVAHALTDVGVQASEEQLDALVLHAGMMLAVNRTHNLTRITEDDDIAFLHIADSLTALPYLEASPPGDLADLGSGAGYPGIPLALMSGRRVGLVESRSKKAAFLAEVVEATGLEAEVLGQRAEDVAKQRRGEFAAVTARALASLPSIVELAAPLLAPGGVLIALKGEPLPEELASGDEVARIVGLARSEQASFVLPGAAVRRSIICYRRERGSSVRLPRRPGMAQRNPLA